MSNPVFIAPKFDAPIADKSGRVTTPWYLALQSLWNPSPEFLVPPTGSPFSFHVPQPGSLLVKGGTVSDVTIVRSTTTSTGQTSGFIPCGLGDDVVITYAVAPTLVFFPR